MKFSYLMNFYREWRDILVIGKTIERDDRKYHIIGMTLDDAANLYIIEPYSEPKNNSHVKRGVRNQRRIMKENRGKETYEVTYLQCSDFYLGDQHLEVRAAP